MSNDKSEKRRETRYAVTGMPDAKLLRADGQEIVFFIVDVSNQGLGIVVDTYLPVGEQLWISFTGDANHQKIELENRWSMPVNSLGSDANNMVDLYRCGLLVKSPALDMVLILSESESVGLEDLS